MNKKSTWTLDIMNMSWVENTEKEVDYLIRTMALTGTERVLDLACGFGRHSLAFAARGFDVVGVDFTPEYIDDARKSARERRLDAEFILADIRDVSFATEFDVVLNLADGAIGYLENDVENLKIFDRIADALKPGGKHFMDVCNRAHAEYCFPKRAWEAGSRTLSLADLDWDADTKRMLYKESVIPYGKAMERPALSTTYSIRLYDAKEIRDILACRGLTIERTFSDFNGTPASHRKLQLMVYSTKTVNL